MIKFKTMDDLKHFLDQTTCLEDRLQAKAILLSTEIDNLRDVIDSLREVSRSFEGVILYRTIEIKYSAEEHNDLGKKSYR